MSGTESNRWKLRHPNCGCIEQPFGLYGCFTVRKFQNVSSTHYRLACIALVSTPEKFPFIKSYKKIRAWCGVVHRIFLTSVFIWALSECQVSRTPMVYTDYGTHEISEWSFWMARDVQRMVMCSSCVAYSYYLCYYALSKLDDWRLTPVWLGALSVPFTTGLLTGMIRCGKTLEPLQLR